MRNNHSATIRRLPAAALLMLAAALMPAHAQQAAATAAAPKWQNVEVKRQNEATALSAAEPTVEVGVRDGYIYITSSEEVNVSVFTILGQLVTAHRMQPGTVRLQIGARGIYILKAGPVTRRLNL